MNRGEKGPNIYGSDDGASAEESPIDNTTYTSEDDEGLPVYGGADPETMKKLVEEFLRGKDSKEHPNMLSNLRLSSIPELNNNWIDKTDYQNITKNGALTMDMNGTLSYNKNDNMFVKNGPLNHSISPLEKKSENGLIAGGKFDNAQTDTGTIPTVSGELAAPGSNQVQEYSFQYEDNDSTYRIGEPTEPHQEEDNDYAYDPTVEATEADYDSWATWQSKLLGAEALKLFPDGCRSYRHYRDGTGTDLWIDYNKAIAEDPVYKKGVLQLISDAQAAAERHRLEGAGDSFSITGPLLRIPNGESENWQKTLGAHDAWASAKVSYENGIYTMTITIHVKDKYNFNKGSFDIGSGAPDSENGRFEVLGWAKPFFTYGEATRTVTWREGSIKDTTGISPNPYSSNSSSNNGIVASR